MPTRTAISGVEDPNKVSALSDLKGMFQHDGLRSEAVYRALREAIVQSVLPEGSRMQDRILAAALGVSRTPVREALQRLEGEGFLKSVPRVGLVVTEIDPQEIENIYTIRIALEGIAAKLAAQRASAGDIEILSQLQARLADATHHGDAQRLATLNQQFHEAIYQAARNTRLGNMLSLMQHMVARFKHSTLSLPERAQEALEEHERLLTAIRNRDADGAEAIMKDHKARAMRARLLLYYRKEV